MTSEEIFVSLPTADDPNKRVSLQDAIMLLVCEVQDLKARMIELERFPALTDELATAVGKMQKVFDTLASQLKGTTAVATAIMTGRRTPGNVN
jgi:hypothetical protein